MLSSAVFVSCLLLAQPEPPANPNQDLAASVRRLVRQLDDEQLAKREAAEKELIKLGPAALDHLPLNDRLSAGVKDALGRVRKSLEAVAVENATTASRVTLKGEMSLADALGSLEKQSGNKIVDYRRQFNQQPKPLNLKLAIEHKTFWEALDTILDQAQLTVYNYGGDERAVSIVARSPDEGPRVPRAVYSGMFRFEGTRVDATRDLRNPSSNSLRLAMEVWWEPRLRPIVLSQPLNALKVTDEKGAPLSLDGREGEIEVAAEGEAANSELYIPLTLPNRDVKKIGSLKGKMLVLAPGRVESFEFTDLEKAKNVEQKRAGVAVIFEQMRKNQDVFEVRLRVKFEDAANALESHRGWIYGNPAHMLDAKGEIVDNAGLEATRQAEDEVGVSYKFVLDDGPAGHKFIYKTPAAILKLPVEYELKDIELP